MKTLPTILLLTLGLFFVVSIFTFAAASATAATPTSFSIESVGSSIGLGNADLKTTTINILQLVLGFLALVAVTMIIASVIIAATSSERAEAAKRTITGAIIGLIIVLLAWAIVLFVARTTGNVTVNT